MRFHPNGGYIGDIRMIPGTAMSDKDSFYIAPDDDVFTSGFSMGTVYTRKNENFTQCRFIVVDGWY